MIRGLCPDCGAVMIAVADPSNSAGEERKFCPQALQWLVFGQPGPHPVAVFARGVKVLELGVVEP